MEHTKETSVFERLLCELAGEFCGTHMLEECMEFRTDTSRRVPLRYRLIAMGFVTGCSLEELNVRLLENGCERLYPRNYWEAGLSFAFLNGLSYKEWRNMQALCEPAADDMKGGDFGAGSISCKSLHQYLMQRSDEESGKMVTRRITKRIERDLLAAGTSGRSYADFVSGNLEDFSHVREKSRYYFCKYLYFYLKVQMERAVEALLDREEKGKEIPELYLFRGGAGLKRKTVGREDMLNALECAPLSWGGIFNAFSAYYFDYVAIDWVEVLLEAYGNLEKLSAEERRELANMLRRHDRKLKDLEDDAVIDYIEKWQMAKENEKDEIYSLDSKNRGYQRNRTQENVVRSYVTGTKDIDRTTLIAFLLFFRDDLILSRERLDHILSECGFPILRKDDGFDEFVLKYLESRHPKEYLVAEVTRHAKEGKNFYLYNTWKRSCSREQELLKIFGI